MASAQRTIDHDEIRRWVDGRGGKPAHVKRTAGDGDPGILRIDFPGFSGEDTLEPIDWNQWFDGFERNDLAFLFQDEGASRFNKLVRRADDEQSESDSETGGRTASGERTNRWSSKTSRVTINDATREELDALYGIGPQNAQRIVAHRRSHGPYESADDLLEIDGIDGATARLIGRQTTFG